MPPQKLSPSTPLAHVGGVTLGDFWSWAYSDLLSNGNRSVLAEFLVGEALGATETPRREWDSADLRYGEKLIEVKASSYTQSWGAGDKPSVISFDIGEKLPWDAGTNIYGNVRTRSADCYVFCLLTETDREQARLRILDTENWAFYVIATTRLNRIFGSQKRATLTTLTDHCQRVGYPHLRAAVDAALAEPPA